MAFVPEDRRKQGLVTESSVARNVAGVIRRGLTHFGLLTSGAENRAAGPWAARLEVKTSALDMAATTMSGGNQQKVVIAKWLATEPKLLIIDEPTRGIDVGTKAEVHRLLSDLAGEGLAVLMISSELPEVLGMADRVLVVSEGQITADIDRADATAENVMYADHRDQGRSGTQTAAIVRRSRHERHAARRAEHRQPHPAGASAGSCARARWRSSACWSAGDRGHHDQDAPGSCSAPTAGATCCSSPSILVLLAVGQAVVIITRNVDLSVELDPRADGLPDRAAVHRPPGPAHRRRRPGRDPGRGGARVPSTACWSPSPRSRRW